MGMSKTEEGLLGDLKKRLDELKRMAEKAFASYDGGKLGAVLREIRFVYDVAVQYSKVTAPVFNRGMTQGQFKPDPGASDEFKAARAELALKYYADAKKTYGDF